MRIAVWKRQHEISPKVYHLLVMGRSCSFAVYIPLTGKPEKAPAELARLLYDRIKN